MSDDAPLRPDIPDLDLIRPIGQGAFGCVWLAVREHKQREVLSRRNTRWTAGYVVPRVIPHPVNTFCEFWPLIPRWTPIFLQSYC